MNFPVYGKVKKWSKPPTRCAVFSNSCGTIKCLPISSHLPIFSCLVTPETAPMLKVVSAQGARTLRGKGENVRLCSVREFSLGKRCVAWINMWIVNRENWLCPKHCYISFMETWWFSVRFLGTLSYMFRQTHVMYRNFQGVKHGQTPEWQDSRGPSRHLRVQSWVCSPKPSDQQRLENCTWFCPTDTSVDHRDFPWFHGEGLPEDGFHRTWDLSNISRLVLKPTSSKGLMISKFMEPSIHEASRRYHWKGHKKMATAQETNMIIFMHVCNVM